MCGIDTCWCPCSMSLSFVMFSKFISNALMRFGPSVALASCWVEPILLLLLPPLLILQVYNMPWLFALSFALLRESCVLVAGASPPFLQLLPSFVYSAFCFSFAMPNSFSIIGA